jgi:integrase
VVLIQQVIDRRTLFACCKIQKRVQMVLKMVALNRNKAGQWFARKGIPADVRAAYKRLHGVSREAIFKVAAGTAKAEAKAQCAEWISQVENTISALRAAAKGEGQPLTKLNALALAGRWYRWFIAQYESDPGTPDRWNKQGDYFTWEVLRPHAPPEYHEDTKADREWRWAKAPEVRAAVRPIVAELARTASFLASEGMALNADANALFVDAVSDNLLAAFDTLELRAEGDYSPDTVPETFPEFQATVRRTTNGMSIWALFEAYIEAKKPAAGTVNRRRAVFRHLQAEFPDTDADALTEADVRAWASKLVTPKRSAGVVADVWLGSARYLFSWGKKQKHVRQNPFAEVRIDVPRKARLRSGKYFTPEEAKVILRATLEFSGATSALQRAQRWAMWLCAYSGARAGEITQLRGVDIERHGEIFAMKLTPEAGSIKTHEARTVPLHEHLIEQGFLGFLESVGNGPLFYNPREAGVMNDPTNPRLAPAVKMRGKLGTWVRSLGVTDRGVGPTHGWRHTFLAIARRAGIDETVRFTITGHALPSTGHSYATPSIGEMAEALEKFPRYQFDDGVGATKRNEGSARKAVAKKRKR